MTAKLSDVRVLDCGQQGPHNHNCLALTSAAELLAMLEAEGVLRREYWHRGWPESPSHDLGFAEGVEWNEWRLTTAWLPREESSDGTGNTR